MIFWQYFHHKHGSNYKGSRFVIGILEKITKNQAVISGEDKWAFIFDRSMQEKIQKIPIGKMIVTTVKTINGGNYISGFFAVCDDRFMVEMSEVST